MNANAGPPACPYDAWLHWYVSERCYLDCEYCCRGRDGALQKEPVHAIRIPELIQALDRTGKVFRISFTGGGEPFLVPNLLDACREITRKHYVSFNTSLVAQLVRPFLEAIDPARVVIIHASCHIKAMERRQLLDRFFENYHLAEQRGIPIYAEEIGYPPLLAEADKYVDLFRQHGIPLRFDAFLGTYQGQRYPAAYTPEEMKLIKVDPKKADRFYITKKKGRHFCNAGYNVAVVQPNGDIRPCDHVKLDLGNIYGDIRLRSHLTICPVAECTCPLFQYDAGLYARALQEQRGYMWRKRLLYFPFRRLYELAYRVTGRYA